LEELSIEKDIAPLFGTPEFIMWNAFRNTEDSRYVGLIINRFLLRPRYDAREDRASGSYEFVEETSNETLLWGNASFAFATCLTRSFADHGWCLNIRGRHAGGVVEGLHLHQHMTVSGEVAGIPLEDPFLGMGGWGAQEFQLAEMGLITLTFYNRENCAVIWSAYSCQKPKQYIDNNATTNSRLSARLPYLFLVSRLSHYLKVIQRENIGTAREADDLQFWLDEWLNQYVIEDASPSQAAKAKHPLSLGRIKVTDIAKNPGFFNVEMLVRPHFKAEGVEVMLSSVSRFPKDSRAYGSGN